MLYQLVLDWPYWEERSTQYRIFSTEERALDAFYGVVTESIIDESKPKYIWLDVMEDIGGEYRKAYTLREWNRDDYLKSLEEIQRLAEAKQNAEKAEDFEVESLEAELSGYRLRY